jgi:hypothetical protein
MERKKQWEVYRIERKNNVMIESNERTMGESKWNEKNNGGSNRMKEQWENQNGAQKKQ